MGIVFISTLISGCVGNEGVPTEANIPILQQEYKDILGLKTFRAEVVQHNGLTGLALNCRLKQPDKQLSEWKSKYDGIELNLTLNDPNGKPIPNRQQKKVEQKLIYFHLLQEANMRFFIPLKDLSLQAGNHRIQIHLTARPAVTARKGAANPSGEVVSLSTGEPVLSVIGEMNIIQPEIKPMRVTVSSIHLDIEKYRASDADFHLPQLGSGFPDLYWKIMQGDCLIFKAPVVENSREYSSSVTSEPFYASSADRFTVYVMDRDVTSEDDVLDSLSVKPSEMPETPSKPGVFKLKVVKELKCYRSK